MAKNKKDGIEAVTKDWIKEQKLKEKLAEHSIEMLEGLKYAVKALKAINSMGATKPIIEELENIIKKATNGKKA